MVALTHQHAIEGTAGLYRLLFERSPHAVLIVDAASLRVLSANDAAAREYGYGREDLEDLPLEELWPGAQEALARLRAGASADTRRASWRHQRKTGEPMDVALALQELSFPGGPALALHLDNITYRGFSAGLLEANSRLLERVARGSPLPVILEELVLAMEALSSGMLGSLLLLDDDGQHARHGAAPNLPPPYWQAINGLRIGPDAGSCGAAMHFDRQVITQDIAADPLWKDYRALALPHGLRACWSTPVRSRTGPVLGAFAMYYREPGGPSERDMRVVQAGADLAAVAIERDRADRALQQSESLLRAIVDHASALISLKDLEGRYLLVNRRFEETTGVRANLALGRTDQQLFGRALAEVCSANDRTVLETRAAVDFEQEVSQREGRRVYLATKFPLLRPDGSPYALCCISTDITARNETERGLEQSHAELRALTAKLQSVREEEQLRISRDLHDHLGQMLTGLRMNQALLVRSVRESPSLDAQAVAAQLESMQDLTSKVLSALRRIVTELRPEVLDALGLAAALEWQAAEFARRTGIPCRVSLPQTPLEVDAERSTALFRIMQEALSNIARHAQAGNVQVGLRRDGSLLEMRIADNGRGISDAELSAPASLGLLGMRERATMLNGTVTIAGAPGHGTTLTVRLPA